ncbi:MULTISPECIES: citrate synthase [Pseudomonas]|uniref:citrate synthase n=1 Tax=Pseudomonas TaxID=286 RepID=UPI000930FE28|nr:MULTISPECIES: citrate synthase [Pseudomonas]MDB6443734.1 citrate synthase [Pseudomonas sp. 21TX0197]MDT8904877.1 citrate synthase [Pseudomonas prosekii]NHN68693.1 DNA-binding protein [Pseudomonas fluorescens]ROO31503.1 DNA-binding protein [Pseudomonas sp. 7SR1]ROO38013.1 DNA-binding protein [Pseudomonas sp. AF76]
MPDQEDLYLSAQESAAMLRVSLPTLYAYVSRKNIRSIKIPGSPKRRYWAEDIQRLVKHPTGAKPSVKRSPPADSAITLITDDGLFYRGHDVTELADHATVEEVAGLMWQVPSAFGASLPRVPKDSGKLLKIYEHLSAPEKAIALFPLVQRENPKAFDLSTESYARTGADVVRWFAALVVGATEPSTQPLHEFITQACGVRPALADLIRRLLILSIDHELDHTTHSVRVAATTGATPYYAVIAGLAAARGHKIAYGRNEAASRMIEEICTATDPTQPILQRYSQDGRIPGFGPNVHSINDPRASNLMQALTEAFAGDGEFAKLQKAFSVAAELVAYPPEFILLVSFIGRKFGLHGQEIALAGVGRLIGWIAHASEQYNQHLDARPRARYTGTLPGTSRQGHA